ncbi:MAG: PKD domain-containing protein, partial [Sedimenticola sp.]|nr:PKD domain-containing protein [Sedimenticola sp.]
MKSRLTEALILSLMLFCSVPVVADDLGEFILSSIKKQPEQPLTEGAMLLLTRDLGWYEKHMAELPQQVQDQVQQLRIRLVGESAQQAAEALGESSDVFLASGSCKPGRDIDVLYVGANPLNARAKMDQAIREKTKAMLAAAEGDQLLAAAKKKKLKIPSSLTSDAMEIVTSDLPNFAYKDLNDAVSRARSALKSGDANAIDQFKQALQRSLQQNLEAQVAASAKDMYRGAAGQRFFNIDYLGDPDKVRRIVAESGSWVLKPGGPEAVSELLQEQVIALMPTSRRAKFAKVASDYAMFFKHGEEAGLSGTAKYVKRIWEDVDSTALLIHIGDAENKALLIARDIAEKPAQASTILALNGLSELDVENGVQRAMHQWVENQLIIDVDSLVKELDSVKLAQAAGSADELEALFRKQLVQFDLNDLASGLSAMSQVPGKGPEEILGVLEKEFGKSEAGQLAMRYIRQQLEIFADNSVDSVGMRLLRALISSGELSPADYHELRARMLKGQELPAEAAKKLQKARSEMLFLGSVNMLELDQKPGSIDQLIEDWKRSRGNALISVADDDVRKTIKELSQLPTDELKKLGWLEAELKLPMETRLRIKLLPDQAADMAERLGRNLSKQALTLNQWQRQARKYIFDLTPTEFGEAGDLGAMDVVFSVANGLYKTYSILNSSPPMKPADENLALANAWVTALPIVGDFADGILSGIEAGFTGNKRKALESGLFVTIGVLGVVPGGQIPAVVASLIAASAPIAGGIYDASQAQNLIQAWIESGNWEGGGDQPMVLVGLFDRAQGHHEVTYEALLTTKGNVPYQSERADGLLSVPTLNGSIRDYAEKYVFPQYPKIKELRESLKLLFPTFNDKTWEDEFDAKLRIEREGGKAALFLFREYYQIRTQALNQTLAQLKNWAEEERRVAHDYEGEIEKATQALIKLQDELNVHSLVPHARRSAEAYTKIIKNTMEHETLPLSRYRIYKHYLQAYQQIAKLVRQIKARLAIIKDGYQPSQWFLTGYPEFDKPRIAKLASMTDNGHKSVVEKVTALIKSFGFRSKGGYDPKNSCHQDAYNILARIRHKISFLENLEDYYKELASNESAWGDAYESARSRYLEVRDSFSDKLLSKPEVEAKRLADAVITFMAAMPYALAADERDLYKSTASSVGIRLQKAMSEFELAGYLTGTAGAALESCLLKSLKIDITLKPYTPKSGETTVATAKLKSATPPTEYAWRWKTIGPLQLDSRYGEKVSVVVDGAGELIVELLNSDNLEVAKVLAEGYVKIVPLSGDAEPEDDTKKKQDDEKKKPEKADDEKALDSTVDSAVQASEWKPLVDALEATRKDKDMRNNRTAEWDKRMQSIRSALDQLRNESKQWLLAWEPYIRELEKVDNKVYHDLQDAVEKQREAYFARCFNSGGESNPAVADECKKKAYAYEESCFPKSLRLAHSQEQKRIRTAKTELPQELHIMTSTGFPTSRSWFEKVDTLAEKHGLPFPYPQVIVPRIDYTSQCASADIEKEKKEPLEFLKVNLVGPDAVVPVGKPVTLSAGVTGGKPPYQYAWSGASGSGATATMTPSWAGDWSVSVTVTDAEGNSGEGVATVRVAPNAIKLKGLKGKVFYGSSATLSAFDQGLQAPDVDPCASPESPFCVDTSVHATMAASSAEPKEKLADTYIPLPDEEEDDELPPTAGGYKIIWQSEPGLTFNPPDSFNGQTTVTYDRMGEVKVWCELLQEIEGSYQTVGECDQETIQVIPPAFTVTFDPQNGQAYVGQQVLATLHAKPSVPESLIDFRWFEPASSNRLEIGPNGNRISFTVKDTNPIKLKALARVPVYGDELGEIESSYTGVAYSVKAWVVQLPNQPMTWDPVKGGLKLIPRGSRAVFERITLKAELQGGTKPDVIRWQ